MVSSNFVEKVGTLLKDQSCPLKQRFRALFTLKNLGGNDAVDQIVRCFNDKSALLKHELAYCLGQMRNPYAIPFLIRLLEDTTQEVVVRHEAGISLLFHLANDCFTTFIDFFLASQPKRSALSEIPHQSQFWKNISQMICKSWPKLAN